MKSVGVNRKNYLLIGYLIIGVVIQGYSDRKLTDSNCIYLHDFFPDRHKILFTTSEKSGCDSFELGIINYDGTGKKIIDAGGRVFDAKFLFSEEVYYVVESRKGFEFKKVNLDSLSCSTILTLPLDSDTYTFALSSLTLKISYVRSSESDPFLKELWICDIDGSRNTRLARGLPFHSPRVDMIDFSPDGQWIIVCKKDGLEKIHIDTKTSIQLTHLVGREPDWSPDGNKIAFSCEDDIYVISHDGTYLINLTDEIEGRCVDPQWSPDGKRISFFEEEISGVWNLWVMSSDGRDKLKLTQIKAISISELGYGWLTPTKVVFTNSQNIYAIEIFPDKDFKKRRITNNLNPIFNTQCVYSGDYKKIAYVATYKEPEQYILKIMDKNGSNKVDLTISNKIYDLCFSPHKRKILYVKEGDRIHVIDTHTKNEEFLTYGRFPKWAPDLTKIAFFFEDYLYIMNSDGSNKEQLASCDKKIGHFFSWSPDSKKIVYTDQEDLWIIDILTKNKTRITTEERLPRSVMFPCFSSDGKRIIYHQDFESIWITPIDKFSAFEIVKDASWFRPSLKCVNNRIYYVQRTPPFYVVSSVKLDGTDKRVETKPPVPGLEYFDVSTTGEIIYSNMDIFITPPKIIDSKEMQKQ